MKRVITLFFALIIGAFLTQGFQCASPELATARVAMQKQRDYPKAEEYLKKELSKNPSNAEAWLEMYNLRMILKQYDEAAKALNQVEKNAKDPKIKEDLPRLSYNLWVNCYNEGINHYNVFMSKKINKYADSAVFYFDVCSTIRPTVPEFVRLKGRVYEDLKDTAKVIEVYKKFAEVNNPNVQFAKEKKLFIGQSRAELINALGNPAESDSVANNGSVMAITDYFKVGNNNFYCTSQVNKNNIFELFAWQINPPENWMKPEKLSPMPMSIEPYIAMAQISYDKKDYDRAIENVRIINVLDPKNSDANGFLIQIYETQGKINEAVKMTQELVASDPKNKYYHAQLGELYFKINQTDDAINAFEKALKIDAKFTRVLRNIAACYKNKAVLIQRVELDSLNNNPKYKVQTEKYTPLLKKSAEYFELCRQTEEFKNDFFVIGELVNIYSVVEEKDKMKSALASLEGIANFVPDDLKCQYWLALVKVYDSMKLTDKLNAAMEEAKNCK